MTDADLDAWRSAAAQWAGIDVDHERFVAFVRERLDPPAWSELDAAGLYIVCACLDRHPRAARAFREHYADEIDLALHRLNVAAGERSDLRSAVFEKLFTADPPKLAAYGGTGSLASWVRAVAVRVALSGQRTSARRAGLVEAAGLELAPSDPELSYLKEHYREAFRVAFEQAVALLDPEDRTLLRHRFVDDLTLEQLAAACGCHRATAARRLSAIRQQLLDHTRVALQRELRVDRGEFESIVRLIQSNFEISVRRILTTSRG